MLRSDLHRAHRVALLVLSSVAACRPSGEPSPALDAGSANATSAAGTSSAAARPRAEGPVELLGCRFGPPRSVAEDTGGRTSPAVAPGAVVYSRKLGGAAQAFFHQLAEDGAPHRQAVELSAQYVSPRGLVAHGKGFLAVSEGRGGAWLLSLDAAGRLRQRLQLAKTAWTSFGAIAANDSHALVAWRERQTRTVHACWVDLKLWRTDPCFEVGRAGQWSQSPRLAATADHFAFGWAEGPTGRPVAAQRAWAAVGQELTSPHAVRTAAAPPSVPVGFAQTAKGPKLVFVHGVRKHELFVETTAGADPHPLATITEAIAYAAVGNLPSGAAIVYAQKGQLAMVRLTPDGSPAPGKPRPLSPAAAGDRHPSAASDGSRLWLAWDRAAGRDHSAVMVRTARCGPPSQ